MTVDRSGRCVREDILRDHGERVVAVEVEVENMKEAQGILFERIDAAGMKHETALKDLCAEVKKLNLRVAGMNGHSPEKHVEVEALDNEPVGWLNSALKKAFKSPWFWILMWCVLKIFFFGEYPAFTQKPRPYMEPVTKAMTEQHKQLHEASIPHLHDETGKPVLLNGGKP